MVISEVDDKVLIELKDFVKITKSLGIKFEVNMWRNHIKNGKLKNGTIIDGIYAVWVDANVYNAVLKGLRSCNNCVALQAKLNNIKLLTDCT